MKTVDNLEYWIQKTLPQVYDDSLSYYELLGKVVAKLNEVIEKNNEYFSQDFTEFVDTLLTKWKDDGTLDTIINQGVFGSINNRLDRVQSFDVTEVNTLYVNSSTGSSLGTGTAAAPFLTLDGAISYLEKLGESEVQGKWEIRVSGYFREGVKIYNLPRFRFPLKITGDTDANGYPTTVFDGQNGLAANDIGMRFEYCSDLDVEVSNFQFKDFKVDFNGYGFLFKGSGHCIVTNCIATNCDIGFAAINSCTANFEKCRAYNCDSGFRAQNGATVTFGRNTATGLTNYYCEAKNCVTGYLISRNAIAHVDYSFVDGCTYAGVNVDMNSRVAVLHSEIKNNVIGILAQGGAEWIDDDNTFTANTTNYVHQGNSRENRLYSQDTNNEFRVGVHLDKVTVTGTTSNTLVHNFGSLPTLPKTFFNSKGKRVRMRVFGVVNGNGNKSFLPYVVNSDGTGLTQIGSLLTADIYGSFVYEMELHSLTGTTQKLVQRLSVQDNELKVSVVNKTLTMNDMDKLFRFYVTLSDAAATVEVEGLELYFMG